MSITEAYQILELPSGSSIEVVKKAFRRLALKYHPDKNQAKSAEGKFKNINAAYEYLSNLSEQKKVIPPVVQPRHTINRHKKPPVAPQPPKDVFSAFDFGPNGTIDKIINPSGKNKE